MFLEMFSFSLKTTKREQYIPITDEINALVKKSGANVGAAKIFIPHTTASVLLTQNADPDIIRDFTTILNDLVPHFNRKYLHSEGNSDSHFKSSLFGVDLEIPIEKGKLALGQWQGVFFVEFDGPRTRKVQVNIFGHS